MLCEPERGKLALAFPVLFVRLQRLLAWFLSAVSVSAALLFLQQQHLLSSVAFSCCCRSHGRWHIANLLFMSSMLLHLIALLFAVQAGAWKACTCIPCAACSASETACLVPVCCFCLHCCSCLLDSPQGLPKSCPTGSLLVLGVPRLRRLGLPGYFSSLLSQSLPLRKFQARTRLRLVSVLLLRFPAA